MVDSASEFEHLAHLAPHRQGVVRMFYGAFDINEGFWYEDLNVVRSPYNSGVYDVWLRDPEANERRWITALNPNGFPEAGLVENYLSAIHALVTGDFEEADFGREGVERGMYR